MAKYQLKEPNILQYYFHPDASIHQVVQLCRTGSLEKRIVKTVDEGLVHKATSEAKVALNRVDGFSHPSNVALYETLEMQLGRESAFFGNEYRALLLAKGRLLGDDVPPKETVLGIDLGKNPYRLFRSKAGYKTIDDKVTYETTYDFLSSDPKFVAAGYNRFEVDKSFVFYFNSKQLEYFGGTREAATGPDMTKLVPLLLHTNDVNLEPAYQYTYQEFTNKMIPHLYSRIKSTMWRKTLSRIHQPKGKIITRKNPAGIIIEEKGPIRDWLAKTYVHRNPKRALQFASFLRKSNEAQYVGKDGRIWMRLHCEDKSDTEGYDSDKFFITSGVYGSSDMPVMGEIQVMTAAQKWKFTRGRWDHEQHEKKRRKQFDDAQVDLMRKIFDEKREMVIEFG